MGKKINLSGKLKKTPSTALTAASPNPYGNVPFLPGFTITLNPGSGAPGATVQAFAKIPTLLNFSNLVLVFTDASGNLVPLTSQQQGAQANELDWVVPQTPSGIYSFSIVLFSDNGWTPIYQAQAPFTVIQASPPPPPPKKKPQKKHGKKKDGKKKHDHKNPKKKHKK